jgi:hypothetical protein
LHTGKFRKLEEGQFCILPLSGYLTPTEAAVSPILLRPFRRLHAGWAAVTPPAPPLSASTRAGTLSRPLLRPFRRLHAGWDAVTPPAPPFCSTLAGSCGRDWGTGQPFFGFCFKVLQVQPINSLSQKSSQLTKTGGRIIVL